MPYTEGTGLQAHTTHPLSLLGLKSNRETGSQQASVVKGGEARVMCGKETSGVGRRE